MLSKVLVLAVFIFPVNNLQNTVSQIAIIALVLKALALKKRTQPTPNAVGINSLKVFSQINHKYLIIIKHANHQS
jgi:hypothetical protein